MSTFWSLSKLLSQCLSLVGLAATKLDDDEDRKTILNLGRHLATLGENLLAAQPRFQDCFFFPNEANVTKLCNYVKKARKEIRICVFSITNNELRDAVADVHKNGVKVYLISDDECSKN
jgi:phosphatidylserine/phosphatidylglycerophosphate/cardiolipin synthase-like enzyme